MLKEGKPKFTPINIVNGSIAIVTLIALFSFWNKLSDIERFICIIILIFVFFLINLIFYIVRLNKYCKKLDIKYQALVENYNKNRGELNQEKYNNNVLRDFTSNTMMLLLTYNDMSIEDRAELRKKIVSNLFNNNLKGGKNDD